MVEIVYDRENLSLTAKGHAKSGEAGHDLVCAAVTILCYTLASSVAQMSADKRHIRRPKVELGDGSAEISVAPIHGMQALTTIVFDTVCAGFDILAQNNPDNVSYTVKG